MKKVLQSMSKFIFAGFGIAVLALLMSLTYGALQRLFPDNFSNQMWGLVMFDIAAMCWAIAFVFQSKSTGQYAAAGIGFIVAFVGTLGMVAAEVMLSGTTLAPEQIAQIGKWMTYGFIVVTAIHAALIYAHHATAPEIHEQINVGVARGEIVTEAITQATKVLDEQKQDLAYSIRNDIISKAKRDLGLIEADPRMPLIPKRYEQAIPYPTEDLTKAEALAQAKALGMWNPSDPNDSPFERSRPEVHRALTQAAKQEDATATARPLSMRFRDWVNSLRTQPAAVQPLEPHPEWTQDPTSTEEMSWKPDHPGE